MSESRVKWEDFDKIHVIRRLREVIGKWWKIQINFTDKKGFLRGVPEGKFFNPLNPVCTVVTRDQAGFSRCVGTARKTTIDATGLKKSGLSRCHAGFSVISVPIHVDGTFFGAVFGDGFLVAESAQEQKASIKAYLDRAFPNREDLKQEVDKLPILSSLEIQYLTELITLVVDEILVLSKAVEIQSEKVEELSRELGTRYGFANMIGKSAPMQALYALLDRICDSGTTVLINGENGTGKELIAKALHYNSKNKERKFLVVNCGAFNENLLESELFGHIKGSFTGAIKDKKGIFEAAEGGTVFLDEIGDTSPQMQVKLLRVLQDGSFTPVGSTEVRRAQARIVAATNKDLVKMVKEGSFREDLYYRLNVINVVVPPLRDRKEDIKLLTDHFLENFAKQSKVPPKKLSKTCLEMLMNFDFPGNIRELENEIERLCVLNGEEELITDLFLSPRIKEATTENHYPGLRLDGKLKDALEDLEKQMILEGLERTGWNKSKLAKELGISRAGLITKVMKYDLDKKASGED